MNKCDLCGKEFNRIPELSRHKVYCVKKHEFLASYNMDKDSLQREYDEIGSVLGLERKYISSGYSRHFFYRLFKDIGVDCSIKKSANHKNVRNRYKETCLEKWGTEHNFSRECQSRKDWEQKLFEEEGITNVFQRQEVIDKCAETLVKKYGSKSNVGKKFQKGTAVSKLNKLLYEILDKYNIPYNSEFVVPATDIKNRKFFIFDIGIDKKLIEINGDYWHGNPEIYNKDDLILKGSSAEKTVATKWDEDRIKLDAAISQGFEVLVIWESEIKKDIISVENKVLNFLLGETKLLDAGIVDTETQESIV